MELAWIEDFIALEVTRNFTRAAEIRFTTQSAYSRRIQRLEEWVGASLFVRDTRPIALTLAGKELAKRIHHLHQDIMDIKRITASASTSLPNALRIYTTNTIAIGLLPRWIKSNDIHNYSLVVSNVSTCKQALKQKKCDVSIIPVFSQEDKNGFSECETIQKDRLSLCALPSLQESVQEKTHKARTHLAGPIMQFSPGTAYGQFVARNLKEKHATIEGPPICESASAEALLAQVKAGLGAAWIPEMLLLSPEEKSYAFYKALSFSYEIIILR